MSLIVLNIYYNNDIMRKESLTWEEKKTFTSNPHMKLMSASSGGLWQHE